MDLLNQSDLEHIAHIIGPQSAAAQALENARARQAAGETVSFYQHGNRIIVHGEPTKPTEGMT